MYFHIWDHMEQYQQYQKKGCVFLQGVISSKPSNLKTVPKEQEKSMVLWCATFLLRCFPDTIQHFQALQLTPSRILNWIFKLLHGLNALWVCLSYIKFVLVKIPSWITKLTSFCSSDISIHSWRCIHWGLGKFVQAIQSLESLYFFYLHHIFNVMITVFNQSATEFSNCIRFYIFKREKKIN